MKHSLPLITATFLLAGATELFAASSVDLIVKGVITPSACTPTLSGGGVVDHGKISIKDLGYNTQLPDATLQFNVACDAATLMAVKSTDNRPGTAWNIYDTDSMFGLGLSADSQKLGAYRLMMTNTTANGAEAPVVESVDGNTWLAASNTVWQPGWMRAISAPSTPDNLPIAVQNLATDLVISTVVRRPTMGTEDIPLDGSATLDIIYL